ncbi:MULTISPECIES: helix-turn-helix domain-containing protein [Providencia]|uniref:helix-turn-helix domain-containing protein n=1 Tax=Providencia TaxID=586 RepID=UPI00197D64EC|nr:MULTISPECIES: helix-turn-helix transcriptional regulator [Providencia]MBN4865933.1 helix-turn-helix transcriptional regulator [Providencia stuartii]MBN4875255.1 helix-turn-helix transcriptional regulator [Providencia stuartii]MBN4879946.1 helix-turn-helix transcriptional regulator [Providencia stuartii]MBN4884533.1 helix-turn-helix transcriptional regulator [Providencia stuartii]HEM8293846.1 helix-turn-helix transcriptional regulator [Providencia stuartii]
MSKKISTSVGVKIRSLRESYGMSGKELSALLGISQQHQSRYENGEVNIHVDTLFQLCQIFDIDPAYFFTDYNPLNHANNFIHDKKSLYEAETLVF